LAAKLGWTEEKVRLFCPEEYRLAWSNNSKQQPSEVIASVTRLHETLSVKSLAHKLELTVAQVQEVFTPSVLRKFYRYPGLDPIPGARRIMRTIRELTNDFELPYSVACWLASQTPRDARRRAAIIRRDLGDLPATPRASMKTWAHAIAQHPDSVEARITSIHKSQAGFALYKAISTPIRLNRIDERYLDYHVPAEAEDEVYARETVGALIAASGLDSTDVSRLMNFFNDPHDDPPASIRALLERLQECARTLGMDK
jgi:hypothetical protein